MALVEPVVFLGHIEALGERDPSRADDCFGGKEAAIERAKMPHSDPHVTKSPEKPSRQVEQQMNVAEARGGQRAELSPHSDTEAPEGTK